MLRYAGREMRIGWIRIENYRSVGEEEIDLGSYCVLVGENNSGKSNFLQALDLFLDWGAKKVDDECFTDKDTGREIKITVRLDDLPEDLMAETELIPFITDRSLKVELRVNWGEDGKPKEVFYLYKRVPEEERLRPDYWDGLKADECKNQMELDDELRNLLGLTGSLTKSGIVAAVEQYIEREAASIDWIEVASPNPKGYTNVLKHRLPDCLFVEAVKDLKDELKTTQSTVFGKLLGMIVEEIPEEDREQITEQFERVREASQQVEAISTIEQDLQRVLCEHVPNCQVRIEVTPPRIEEVIGASKVWVNDGIETLAQSKGHGLQRSLIVTLLRVYADKLNQRREVGEEARKNAVLLVEEPELYLHPHLQRTAHHALADISTTNQVIASTHSGYFVDVIPSLEQMMVFKKMGNRTKIRRLREGTLSEEDKQKIRRNLDPGSSQMFFARLVLLVEGAWERFAIPFFADTLFADREGDSEVPRVLDRWGVSVVDVGGRENFLPFMKVLQPEAFDIPYIVMCDADARNALKNQLIDLGKWAEEQVQTLDSEQLNQKLKEAGCFVLSSDFETLVSQHASRERIVEALKEAMGDEDLVEEDLLGRGAPEQRLTNVLNGIAGKVKKMMGIKQDFEIDEPGLKAAIQEIYEEALGGQGFLDDNVSEIECLARCVKRMGARFGKKLGSILPREEIPPEIVEVLEAVKSRVETLS